MEVHIMQGLSRYGDFTWVQNHDELLVVCVQGINKWAKLLHWVVLRAESEVFVMVHMVNVGPHGFHRNVHLLVPCHHGLQLLHILVPVPGLVETWKKDNHTHEWPRRLNPSTNTMRRQ
jgi:hypothetical protein